MSPLSRITAVTSSDMAALVKAILSNRDTSVPQDLLGAMDGFGVGHRLRPAQGRGPTRRNAPGGRPSCELSILSTMGSLALRRFLMDLWAWVGGSREWHGATGRYHVTRA